MNTAQEAAGARQETAEHAPAYRALKAGKLNEKGFFRAIADEHLREDPNYYRKEALKRKSAE